MKKIAILSLTTFSLIGLSGCEMINSLLQKDEGIKYEGFVNEFRNVVNTEYVRATETDATVAPETHRDYIYNKETHWWVYTMQVTVEGVTADVPVQKHFEAYYYAMELKETADKGSKDVDSVWKFSKNEDGTFTISAISDDAANQLEIKFRSNGLMDSMKGHVETREGSASVSYVYNYHKSLV